MVEPNIVTMVNDVFEESFEIEREKLSPESSVFNDLGLDSLDVVDLIVALQKKFGLRIQADERIKDIRTLEDIYHFISQVKKDHAS